MFDAQYCDAIRLGDLELFKAIEKESSSWWTAELDRGAGSPLHIAVDHGQVRSHLIICIPYDLKLTQASLIITGLPADLQASPHYSDS